jgi:predicted deacetylase
LAHRPQDIITPVYAPANFERAHSAAQRYKQKTASCSRSLLMLVPRFERRYRLWRANGAQRFLSSLADSFT